MYYDLHLHSALSPCGDGDMTPNNIVHMAVLKGLQVIALTDHNSCKNCPALVEAARGHPLQVLCGMEINTSEEIHAVCLFPTLEQAMAFDQFLYPFLPDIQNQPEIFGQQQIFNGRDELVASEPRLLINACGVSIMELPALMRRFGGLCWPAHIDKPSYSILSSLGMVPPECGFLLFEVKEPARLPQVSPLLPEPTRSFFLHNSDAHYLWDIAEPVHALPDGDAWQVLSHLYSHGRPQRR